MDMQTYDSYKDSGIDWVGEIPSHWEVERLASLGYFSSSGIDKLSKEKKSIIKIVNYTDVYRNKNFVLGNEIDYMIVTTPEINRLKNLLIKGDLIYLPSSETFDNLNLCALVNESVDNLSYSYHVLRFRFRKELNHNFKKYF